MKYRPEIDGLRAIAVLPVILFHVGFSWLPGGYLGVDVFFVISGFLITSVLLSDLCLGNFSIVRFYERRARRILPSLLLVIATTLLLSPLFMWDWQIEHLSDSAIATLGFFANHYFLNSVDYFRTNAETYPLLHMWSLAVEEQYYFIMPLILVAVWKSRQSEFNVLAITFIITSTSFVLAYIGSHSNAAESFYLLISRAYEIGIGALAAIAIHINGRLFRCASKTIVPICIAVILLSYYYINPTMLSPLAKLPLLLATAVILSCESLNGFTYSALKSPPMRWIGLISFSLYLWHQPVLAFYRLNYGDIDFHAAIGLILLCIGLSVATYRFVESPCRRNNIYTRRIFRLSATGLTLVAAIALLMPYATSANITASEQDRALAINPDMRVADLWQDYNLVKNAPFENNDKTNILIVGDSFSQDFYLMAIAVDAFEDMNVSARYIPAKCQPYWIDELMNSHTAQNDRVFCAANRKSFAPDASIVERADIVIFAASWRDWSANMINDFVEQTPHAETIVIGTKSFKTEKLPSFRSLLRMNVNQRMNFEVPIPESVKSIADTMRASNLGPQYVDFLDLTCDMKSETCPLFDHNGFPVTFDGVHLTREGAEFFGPRIFNSKALSRFLGKN